MVGIAEGLRLAAEALGIVKKRQELVNDPKVQAKETKQNEIDEKNRIENNVRTRNSDGVKSDWAE